MHIRELFHKPKLYVMTSLEKKVGYISDDLSQTAPTSRGESSKLLPRLQGTSRVPWVPLPN